METHKLPIEGKTLKSVDVLHDDDEIIFETVDGEMYRMYHEQDCCESVLIEDICGNLDDLVGVPILVAEERTQYDLEAGESGTWTFYTLRTVKGTVDIRWHGTSNGYYSESVDFKKVS
jgi:hypothetical protein